MGGIIKAVGSLLGIGGGAPKVDATAASNTVADADAQAKNARSALLETAGGQSGAQLQPGQVTNTRQTLLGN